MLSFHDVSFFYPSSVHPILENINAVFDRGWTGITGDNGAGKTTLLLLAAKLLRPASGAVTGPAAVYCPQRTDELPPEGEDFVAAGDREAGKLISRLGIGADWPWRWETLSHGERKRLQLGIVLWKQPEVLALDEPANHLDSQAKALILDALTGYEGTGLLVSHDRTLLDRLCGRCLFLRDGQGVIRNGGISRGLLEEERERTERRRIRKKLSAERDRLAAGADERRRVVEGAKNRLSKKRIAPGDSDARGKINLARLSGKDRTAADSYGRMKNRAARAEADLAAAAPAGGRKEGITLETAAAKMDRLCAVPAGTIPLGGFSEPAGGGLPPENPAARNVLAFPDLRICPLDRIALTGPNGSGKSTLVRFLRTRLPPALPALYIPQEISAEEGRRELEGLEKETEQNRGEILARFSRLGSDPRFLLQSRSPSPGEIRKLLIARGLSGRPALIIMDEPLNHMDLTSIRLLEEALKEAACALLLVSHDEAFLEALTNSTWSISGGVVTVT
ncbi:MAG: ATP-binding cassette domain-containing protein [Spirochaetaceae bacterium]|nr:ATP-binding cassette domain-containing protein [Spirochaetaceae bacterium]